MLKAVTGSLLISVLAAGAAFASGAAASDFPISFSGLVTNATGTGVPSVTVELADTPSLSATTAGDGSFTISGIPAGSEFTIKASGSGVLDAYAGPFGSTGDITKTIRVFSVSDFSGALSSGKGVITGQVVVPGSGVPLQGATVSAPYSPNSYSVLYDDGSGNPVSGSATGSNGTFYLLDVEEGKSVILSASKGGWSFEERAYTGRANATVNGDIAAATIQFSGRISDSGNNPLQGVSVQLPGYPGIGTSSAADGSFTLAGLPSGHDFTLLFGKQGYAPTYSIGITSTIDITDTVPIVMFQPDEVGAAGKGVIRGAVVDPASATLGGATVTASSALHPDSPYDVSYFDGTSYGGSATYDNGVYIIRDVDDGDTVTVAAAKPGWRSESQTYPGHGGAATEGLNVLSKILFAAEPGTIQFGSVTVGGRSPAQILTITNVSGSDVTITDWTLAGHDAEMFQLLAAGTTPCQGLPATFAPGVSCTVAVTFAPTGTGARNAVASITTSDPTVAALELNGSGIPDTAAPVVTFSAKTPVATLTVPVTSFSATDDIGVTGYLLTETAAPPPASADGWSGTAPTSYTFATAGSKTLYAWAKDGAGNVSACKSAIVKIDMTPPAVTAFSVKSPVNTLTVPVTSFTASDAAGVTGYLITASSTRPLATAKGWSVTPPKSYVSASTSIKTLYAWAKDAAGNVSPAKSAAVTIDMTAPAVTAFALETPVNTLTVPVTLLTASDASGVTGYLITATSIRPSASAAGWSATAPKGYTFTSAGIKTLYAWARDAAGNVSAARTAKVNIDLTPPLVTAFSVKTPVTTLTVPVTLFSASDATGVAGYLVTTTSRKPLPSAIGWSPLAPKQYSFGSKGSKVLYAWAKDAAGNVSLAKTATVVID